MVWAWGVAGLCLALLIGLIVVLGPKYRKVFSDPHAIEFSESVVWLKAAAVKHMGMPKDAPTMVERSMTLHCSENCVFHFGFGIDADGQRQFEADEPFTPDGETIRPMLAEVRRRAKTMRLEHFNSGLRSR